MQKIRIDGDGAPARPVGRPRREASAMALSEMDVPRFAKLVKLAAAKEVVGETRLELYRKLGLSREQKIEVETAVVEHFCDVRLAPELVERIVRHNLFYVCEDRSGKPIYEDQLFRAFADGASVRVAAERLNLSFNTAWNIRARRGMKSAWKRYGRLDSWTNGSEPDVKYLKDGRAGEAVISPERELLRKRA